MTTKDIIHKGLAGGRWFELSFAEQMANVGSDVERAIRWHQRGDKAHFEAAFDRTLELLDLTIADPRWRYRLKELTRLRESICDFFYGGNSYNTTPEFLQKYFLFFGILARSKVQGRAI